MTRCDSLKKMKAERGISLHFPVTHLHSPSVFETRALMLGSVIQVKGVSFDTENNETLNRFKRLWHQSILSLGENFAFTVTFHRRKENIFLEGNFNNQFLKEINHRYHEKFKTECMYVNDIYITILTRGLTIGKPNSMLNWLSNISSKAIQKSYEWKYQEQSLLLNNAVRQMLVLLSEFSPTLLGSRDESLGYSELLRYFSLLLNGGEEFRPDFFYPSKNLSYALSHCRLFFSEAIEFHGFHHEKIRFAAMVSIKKYAPQTECRSLDNLLKINSEYISTNTFFTQSKDMVQKAIGRQRRKLENVNDPAKSQINSLSSAQDQLASDRILMGEHHNTVMVIADSIEKLNRAVAKTIKCYSDAGFVAIRETIGQEPAFWAQIPGNAKMIVRGALITSENFVDFCPLHNYRTGYRDQNHLGSAVTLLKTPSNTPYFFNFHTKGNKNNPSKGHTTMIGGNGSGKTVAIAFFDAQLSRYGGRTFVFDRDRGLEIYIRACGGYYAILSPDHPHDIHFNPFQMTDTAVNRKFCREWMSQLIKEENEMILPADLSEIISQCVDYVFDALPIKDRCLSNAAKLLPIHFPRWSNLRQWLRSHETYPAGEYAYLFDNINDDFEIQDKMGFDMTHFLDTEPKHVLVAVMMYLFHRLEQSLDGRLVSVLLDEGWQYLDNPYWSQKLRKWLPTLRKLNCHLVLATQSAASVAESSIRSMILDNVATHIYFANPQAKSEYYQDGFNLSHSEFRCIKENNPSQHIFLLKQDYESALCQLDLSSMQDIISILSGNRKTLLLCEEIRKQYGNDVNHWLPKFRQKVKLCE